MFEFNFFHPYFFVCALYLKQIALLWQGNFNRSYKVCQIDSDIEWIKGEKNARTW